MKLINQIQRKTENVGIDLFTNVSAKIASVFSVIFAMSIVYELKSHVDLWLIGVLSVFILFFLIVNETIKIKSIKTVHNGNNKALLSFIFTFVISIALSGTGIYLWVNKTQEINSQSLKNKTEQVNEVKSKYTQEIEKIKSKSFEDTKEFLNLKESLDYWKSRSAGTLDERTEIRETVKNIQDNINKERKEFNEEKKSFIKEKQNELQSKLDVIDVEFNNQSKEVNRNNLLTYILFSLVIIVEFAIVYLNNSIAKKENEILNLKNSDEVNKYLIGRKILETLYLTSNISKNGEYFTDINKAKYSYVNKKNNLQWEDIAEIYNLYIDLGILDNGSTVQPKNENRKGLIKNVIQMEKSEALKKYDVFHEIALS